MDLNQIRYFLGVAKELHFSRASEKLYIAQSALSRQIKQLETDIGVTLLDRNKRNVQLTTAGVFLQTEWTRLLDEFQNIHRRARQLHQGERGTLRIGHPGSAIFTILPKSLALFHQKFPEVHIELQEIRENLLMRALLQYEVDLGFCRETQGQPGVVARTLFDEPFALVLPHDHPLQSSDFQDLRQVQHEAFVLPSFREESVYCQKLYGIFKSYDFAPQVRYESDFGLTIMRFVEQGLGVAILPLSYQNAGGHLLRFIELPFYSSLNILYRAEESLPMLNHYLHACMEAL
jgi:LysR family transcriptional regulator, benzoate and cis,cis-muconate-responsive activator of ben and cat genes